MKTHTKLVVSAYVCIGGVILYSRHKRAKYLRETVAWAQASSNDRITQLRVDRFDSLDPWEPANWALLTYALNNDFDGMTPEERTQANILLYEFNLVKSHR